MIEVKIKKITKRLLEKPMPVYDVVGAVPHNNFLIKTKSYSIISHNCSPNDVIGLDILCLTGDTKIWEANGNWTPIKDLENKTIKVFNYNIEDNYVALSDTCKVEQTSTTQDLIEIEMIDGSCIRCTPNHRFLLKDGTYKRAKDLTDEDELEDGMSI